MAFCIDPGEPVARAVRGVVEEQLVSAVHEARDTGCNPHTAVHEVRKRCKKMRGVLRLARKALGKTYAKENACFRDAARNLSGTRDATALFECYERVCHQHAGNMDPLEFAPVRTGLVARRDAAATQTGDVRAALDEVAAALDAARARLQDWPFKAAGFDALGPGLARTYRRGRKGMKKAYDTQKGTAFHEWRKRVKYHRYHLALLRNTWTPVVGAAFSEVKYLSDLLGEEHDITLLNKVLRERPGDFGGESVVRDFVRIAKRQRADLRARARPIGLRVYAEQPASLRHRYAVYWEVHRAERQGMWDT
ncbi:MAG: CHAD domain-containing protein [Candidatus Hydrogenedentota bacterium]